MISRPSTSVPMDRGRWGERGMLSLPSATTRPWWYRAARCQLGPKMKTTVRRRLKRSQEEGEIAQVPRRTLAAFRPVIGRRALEIYPAVRQHAPKGLTRNGAPPFQPFTKRIMAAKSPARPGWTPGLHQSSRSPRLT